LQRAQDPGCIQNPRPFGSRPKLVVSADGRGVVGHAGSRLLADLADATGLRAPQSKAPPFWRDSAAWSPSWIAVRYRRWRSLSAAHRSIGC
jgi:hypothetical protein